MELHSRVFKVALASAIGLFAVIGAQEESAASEYRYLCTSVPSACEYAPPTAPSLKTDVCWDGSAAFVMPAGGCGAGEWPYYVEAGEVVDPVTNQVEAYIPLNDACAAGFCVVKPPGTTGTTATPICCGSYGCVAKDGACPASTEEVLWCFEGQEPVQQGGKWECYESE